jgi:2Fe-2S ferredoxin
MPIVRVEPLGAEIEVHRGEPLAFAAWRLGYRWPTVCWGQGDCMLCRVEILAGDELIEPPDGAEIAALRAQVRVSSDRVRLACRLRVTGDGVVVEKKGVVAPEPTSESRDVM